MRDLDLIPCPHWTESQNKMEVVQSYMFTRTGKSQLFSGRKIYNW